MRVFAYCCASMLERTRRAAGMYPRLCPPINVACIAPRTLEGYDLLYLMLHGMPDQPFLYGDRWETALSAETVRSANLAGSVVYSGACYLAESPMLPAFLEAGAVVIGGSGRNYSVKGGFDLVDLLGQWVRYGLAAGLTPERALRLGKARLRLGRISKERRDTLKFEMWVPGVKA